MAMAAEAAIALDKALSVVEGDRKMGAGIRACQDREQGFTSKPAMMLAGAAMIPAARQFVNDALDEAWADAGTLPDDGGELVIGAGLHAAVYCAVRVARGYPKPAVAEASGVAGGTFALGDFRLNSTTAPGVTQEASLTVQRSLNYIPGAPVQVSDFSGERYPMSGDMAFAVRCSLAMNARVYPSSRADVSPLGTVTCGGVTRTPYRIIRATGCGVPDLQGITPDGDRVMTFPQLLERMRRPFPLQGMKRIAIIGGGDSGTCAAEELLMPRAMSPSGLDFPQVDWYAPGKPQTPQEWVSRVTRRYLDLAPHIGDRLRVINARAEVARAGDLLVAGAGLYDHVVICTGFETPRSVPDLFAPSGIALARKYGNRRDFTVGPAAQLPYNATEEAQEWASEPNKQSVFRLAPRTAALAATLQGI